MKIELLMKTGWRQFGETDDAEEAILKFEVVLESAPPDWLVRLVDSDGNVLRVRPASGERRLKHLMKREISGDWELVLNCD
jgi:hypothetical protein